MSALRTILLIAMVIVGLNAVETTRRSLTNAQMKRIETLKAGNSWGSLLVNLAELHMLAQGPIDDLVAAIQAVIADLDVKVQNADADFEKRTQEHNTEVRQLTDLINEAQRNIADTQSLIENVLIPQRNQLLEEITNLNNEIDSIKAYINQATIDRKAGYEAWTVRTQEHNDAIAAIQESLAVLDQLDGGDASLVQVKKIQKSVDKITKKIQGKRFVETTFVKSLLALTNTEFANSEALTKVRNLFATLLTNLEASLNQEATAEAQAQADFINDIINQNQKLADAISSLQQKQTDLSHTEEQITAANEYIEERTADLAGYQADLDAENAAYEEATNTYNDLIAQLNSERDASNEALTAVQNLTVADYIGSRIDQTSEHVIGTNHGSGVEVAGGRFEFN